MVMVASNSGIWEFTPAQSLPRHTSGGPGAGVYPDVRRDLASVLAAEPDGEKVPDPNAINLSHN